MKTAISIPDEIFRSAEQLAQQRRIARSTFYTEALSEYLERHRIEGVAEQLNAIYAQEEASDYKLLKHQKKVLSDTTW